MKLPQQVQRLLQPLLQLANKIVRYRLVLGLLLILALVGFLNFRITQYAQTQSDQDRLNESLSQIKQVRFDSSAVDKIKSLSDQGTQVDPQLPTNRLNPFQD